MDVMTATNKQATMAIQAQEIVRSKDINSFQKLRLLLWLFEQSGSDVSSAELAEQLFLGDVLMLENMLDDLQIAGLLDYREHTDQCISGRRYALSNRADVKATLRCLSQIFADPAARQALLDEVRRQQCYGNYVIVAAKGPWAGRTGNSRPATGPSAWNTATS